MTLKWIIAVSVALLVMFLALGRSYLFYVVVVKSSLTHTWWRTSLGYRDLIDEKLLIAV